MQSLYLIEFVFDIFKRYFLKDFNSNKLIIDLFMKYDTDPSKTSVEIDFYIIVYCFYIQYKLYDNSFYKTVIQDEKVTLTNFILVKFHSHPNIRNILFFVGKILIEIYIWILIVVFIFFDTYFEISIIFEIKLIIFFLIVYQFLISIHDKNKKNISLILNWIFLGYCSLNSFLVYCYQFICLDFFNFIPKKQSDNFFINNLPSIGFSNYKDKLYFRFLPHFVCNFISILFLWEMKRILSHPDNILAFDDMDKEIEIEKDDDDDDDDEKKEKLTATEMYEQNKKKMNTLNIYYYVYNIVLLFTKFYWLFLFIYLGIIFTTIDLSILLILYILIFGIIYIRMFYQIITKLNRYIKEKSYYISRLIRYNLIELSRHEQQNRYFRIMGFDYILVLSLLSYLFYYSFGVFHKIQNGCAYEDNNEKYGWEGCDNRHQQIINDEDSIITSVAYLVGFCTENDYVFEESWFHLVFAMLVCFDVYVLQLEALFNEKIKKNREGYKYLANQNVQLKPLTFGEANILMNISHFLNKAQEDLSNERLIQSNEQVRKMQREEEERRKKNNESYFTKLRAIKKNAGKKDKKSKIKFKIDTKNKDEDTRIGEKLIKDFLHIFENTKKFNDVKLSDSNNKLEIEQVVKKVFEELIIFLLICASISKMDVWSFVYIIISLILITTKKAMFKFYILYCFLFITTLLQSILFVSNIQRSTEPNPDIEILRELNRKFNVPWYKHGRFEMGDKMGYFLGVGASKSQINLIWMEFIEIILIYIYLDYFSYSIYQEENTIRSLTDKKDKINYFNLFFNKQTREISKKLSQEEYEGHVKCMKYNFNVDLTEVFKGFIDFQNFMQTGRLPNYIQEKKNKKSQLSLSVINEVQEEKGEKEEEEEKVEEKKQIEEDKPKIEIKEEEKKPENEKENKGLMSSMLSITSIKNADEGMKEKEEEKVSPFLKSLRQKKTEQPSGLLKNLTTLKAKQTGKKSLFQEAKSKDKDNKNKCYSLLKDFLYLSFHNVILVLIIIISMTISGLFSVFYIFISLYFLITSTTIYLGKNYLYPRAIKTLYRIVILLDILGQILYQSPFFESGNKVLEIIGFNKILNFTKVQEKSSDDYYDITLDIEQLFLILAKAFTYLLMSFQVLVYSSQSFQEYYLSYIITKNNILRRISLMNVFKFNNNRIDAMNKSLNLRHDMAESMQSLAKVLNEWNVDLKKTKTISKNKNKKKKKEKEIKLIGESKDLSIIEEEKKDDKNLTEKKPKMKILDKKVLFKSKKKKKDAEKEGQKEEKIEDKDKKEEEQEDVKEEKEKKEENIEELLKEPTNEEIKEEKPIEKRKRTLFGLSVDSLVDGSDEEIEEDEEDKILPKEEVFKRIKDILLGGFFTKLYLKINKYASNYMTIKKNEKDLYEKNTIKGDSKMVSFIESQVDMQLNLLVLNNFTSREMKEVVHYFDGTMTKKEKEKKEKEKKEKEKKEKEKKEKGKKDEANKDKDEAKEEEKMEIKEEDATNIIENEKIKDDGDETKKKKEEKIIDLNDAKFKQFENFISLKLYVKYLSRTYIIKCIIKEIFSFFLNNFHWPCYFVMILSHIIQASFLTSLYPLSIFCYALLEYPRPSKMYWKIVLLYTVFLLTMKFIIHIEVLRNIESFKNVIQTIYNYKIGVKIYDSSFSTEFFRDLLFDALVIIFLLINDYLLVSRGVWSKREQEIENIYQANERIAKTNLLKKKDEDDDIELGEVKDFNNRYLEPIDYSIKEDKKKNRFSILLITDDKEKEVQNKENEEKVENKPTDYNKIIKGYKLQLSSMKGRRTRKSINRDSVNAQNILTQKIKELQLQKEKEEKEKKAKEKYDESKRKYYERLFPRVRNEKPGNEFYAWYTVSMALIIIFILVFYTSMVKDATFGAVQLDTKQFSGEMVLVLLFHVAILVYDRVLYISQSRSNLKFEYLFYDKKTGMPVDETKILKDSSQRDKLISPKKMEEFKEKYNIISIQTEDFNYTLLQKYILQIVMAVLVHLFIFFYCPMTGNNNIYGTPYCEPEDKNAEESEDDEPYQCNDFRYNYTLIICYLLYLVYLISSGLQIKYGFYDMKRKSMLKAGDKSLNGTIYNAYKAIPFLYEIKLAIDWTFTKTCLDLFQWNKFEGVYDAVYVTYCQMNAKNEQLVGQKVGKLNKITMGGLLAFILILILLAPLMLFSSLNPTNKMNNLTGAVFKIDLCFFYKNKAVQNYTLYENTRPESIEKIDKFDMDLYNYSSSIKTKNFDKEQIQTVKFYQESDKNWDLTGPLIENLIYLILKRKEIPELEYIALAIDYNFDRPLPMEANKINKRYIYTIYYYNNYTGNEVYERIEEIGKALSECHDAEIEYSSVYSPPIRLSSNIKPKRLSDPKYFPNLGIKLGYVGCKNVTNSTGKVIEKNYLESYFTLKKVMNISNEKNEEGIKFHVFSDKVSSTTSGQSILTLYVSFVLLVGTYVRNFFAGQPEKIMLTEMPYSKQIIDLCEGIKVSRNSFDFQQEEKLYYRLIELMRSPEYLRTLTKSSNEQFRRRREMTKKNKTTNGV